MTDMVYDPLEDGKSVLRLEQVCASDLMVVNAARVSFGDRSEEIGEKEVGLINYLLKNRHGTPFEHNMFTYHVKCPIFVAREWVRHRIGSFNEFSARYKEMQPDFYVPRGDAVRGQVGRPGHYTFEPIRNADTLDIVSEGFQKANHQAWEEYQLMLANGVAKEVARMVLPVNIYTEFYWTINARALMNFLSLRNSEHAQREIRQFAQFVEVLFSTAMPVTYAAFQNERIAP